MAGFILKDWYGKEQVFDNDKIFVKDENGELVQFTQGAGASPDVRYVTFMSYDGLVEYGKKAVAVGDDCADPIARGVFATPTRESDVQYNYTFYGWATTANGAADSNWNKAVTVDKTVYANFSKTVLYYTVTYYDSDGTTVLKTESLAYGTVPSYTPTKSGYDFAGWEQELVAVTGEASYTATWTEEVSFAKSSWATIAAISEAGEAKDYFAIGDSRVIPVTYDGATYNFTAKIVGFDHDDLQDGGKAGMSILFFTTPATTRQYNGTNWSSSNYSGWGGSSLRTFLYWTFINYLPSDLRAVMKYVQKPYNFAGTSTMNTENCRIWIPSVNEAGGTKNASHSMNTKIGTAYEYFAAKGYGDSTDASTKVVDTAGTTRTEFWMRDCGKGNYNVAMIQNGSLYGSAASGTRYVAIGFCI